MSYEDLREQLAARAKELRQKAEAFRSRCTDDKAKLLVTRMVISHVDDVEHFFLGENGRHLNPKFAFLWWDGAEQTITMGEQGLASLAKQFAQFGGPENVQVIGE